jgi:hypothetical protein
MSYTDEVLEFLVRKVEETGVGIAITLCVNGLVVTGTTMRSRLYFDEMSKLFDTSDSRKFEFSTDDPIERDIGKKYFQDYKEFMQRKGAESHNAKEVNSKFIHLSRVMIYPTDEFPSSDFRHPVTGLLWRGRLSSVDGFFIGEPATLTYGKPEAEATNQAQPS